MSLNMSKSLLGTLLGLAVLALVSTRLEGVVRTGAWAGFLMGTGVGCAIVGWQAGAFRRTPKRALEVMALGFLIKLVALAGMGMIVKHWEPLALRLDWEAFLLASAAGMFLLLILGTVDNAGILKKSSAAAPKKSQSEAQNQNRDVSVAVQANYPSKGQVSEGRTSL